MSLHTILCVALYCSSFIVNDDSSNSSEITGVISSPGYPNSYPNGLKAKYTITAKEENIIQIVFLEIKIEKDHDTIHISEEPASSRLVDSDDVLKPIISTSNNITILFNTDHSRTFPGFLLNFTEIEISKAVNTTRDMRKSGDAQQSTNMSSDVNGNNGITLYGLIGFIAGCFFTVSVSGAIFLINRYRLRRNISIQPSLLNVRHNDEVIYQNTQARESCDEGHYENVLLSDEDIGSVSNPAYGTHNLVIYNENHYIDMCIVQQSSLK